MCAAAYLRARAGTLPPCTPVQREKKRRVHSVCHGFLTFRFFHFSITHYASYNRIDFLLGRTLTFPRGKRPSISRGPLERMVLFEGHRRHGPPYQSTLDAVCVNVVPRSDFSIVPSFPDVCSAMVGVPHHFFPPALPTASFKVVRRSSWYCKILEFQMHCRIRLLPPGPRKDLYVVLMSAGNPHGHCGFWFVLKATISCTCT